ncbi:MAG: TolC family outer membrane protein [Methyloprofundus sp.]|nr:TolC family outer membrane protein [Methyloprofundus sp.]MDT8424537.1 TolC family outer membrane protein [Methyloprofundus sp.]
MATKIHLHVSSLAVCLIVSTTSQAQTLQETIQYTLNNNPHIQAAKSERNAVVEQIGQARAGYLPSVDLSFGYGYENSTNPTLTARNQSHVELDRREASIQIRQMLFDGFATQSEVERHTARADSRSYTVFGQSEIIALEATEAHLNVLRRNELVKLAEDNLHYHQSTHDQIILRANRGVGKQVDAEQSSGRLSLAEANYISESGNQQDAQTKFLRTVGILPTALATPSAPEKLIPKSLDDATEQAINNHPVLKSANAEINSAFAQYETAHSPFYPRVDVELGSTFNNNMDGIKGENNDLSAMIRVRYNLFNGGKDLYRQRETSYLINQSKDIRDNAYRQVVESMRLSWTAYKIISSQLGYLKGHMDSSIKANIAYKKQFNIGQRSLLDLLDSANELFTASVAYTNAKYDMHFAQYRLLASMGQLNAYLGTQLAKETEILSEPRSDEMPWHEEMTNNETARLNLF